MSTLKFSVPVYNNNLQLITIDLVLDNKHSELLELVMPQEVKPREVMPREVMPQELVPQQPEQRQTIPPHHHHPCEIICRPFGHPYRCEDVCGISGKTQPSHLTMQIVRDDEVDQNGEPKTSVWTDCGRKACPFNHKPVCGKEPCPFRAIPYGGTFHVSRNATPLPSPDL